MSIQSLKNVISARAAAPVSWLPASGVIGLAAPIAALGVVLVGMNLPVPGLFGWVCAIAMMAYVLRPAAAAATIVGVAACGFVLRLLIDTSFSLSTFEQLAFGLMTIMAWVSGQLWATHQRDRCELSNRASQLGMYESMMASVFDGSRDCIKLIAADGTVLAINDHGLKLIGAAREAQMVGKNWLALWDPEHQKRLGEAWDKALQGGVSEFVGSTRILSGEYRTWLNTFTAVRLPDLPQPHLLCFSRDITDTLTAQRSLQDHVMQLNSLLNSIDDAFFALDADWSISFINQRGEQLFRHDNHHHVLRGKNFWEIFPVVAGDEAAQCLRRAMERQSIQRCEHFVAERQTWFGITAFPYPGGISVLVRDITPLLLAEKQITEENTRLQVAQDIAGFGDWSFDYQQGLLKLSPRAVTLLGLGTCEPQEYKKRVLERLHPQDRMALIQAIIHASASDMTLDLSVRMPAVTVADSDRHIHWVGRLISDERGPRLMIGAVQDITAHFSEQDTLEQAQQFVRGIIDALPQYVGVIDYAGEFITVNRAWREGSLRNFQRAPNAENFFAFAETAPEKDRLAAQVMAEGVRNIIAGKIDRFETEYDIELSGEVRNFIAHATPLKTSRQDLIVFSHSEITDIKKLTSAVIENEQRLRELAENVPEILWTYDVKKECFTYVSPAFEHIYKVPCRELTNNANLEAMTSYIHPDDRQLVMQSFQDNCGGQNTIDFEYRIIDACGDLHWLSSRTISLRDEHGEVLRLTGTARDITEHKNYEQRLFTAAHIDDLTGLPNRKSLMEALHQHFSGQTDPTPFVVMIVNLDRFKNINDTLGHNCGDDLLVQASRRIAAAAGERSYVARLGGDEFAVVVDAALQPELIDAVMASFAKPFDLQGEQAFVTASIGAASCPNDATDALTLLRLADVAMQRAKMAGRNNYQSFIDTMMLPSRERLALENELRTALEQKEFELFYQGKIDLDNGALVGAEALLRWHSKKRGLVSPADFIPLLEETGLILPVGEWILAQACAQVCEWHQRSGVWFPVAVNVSALQIASREFGNIAIAILKNSGVPAGIVELEITESALMTDVAHGSQLIKTLKAAGYSIALDDFGTGYSSLGYLRKFCPNTLKIDRSFIIDLTTDQSDVEIVAGIVQLAKALKIEVVAEGIEESEQRRILCELGCHRGQGFLFCKPLPVTQFENLLEADRDRKRLFVVR